MQTSFFFCVFSTWAVWRQRLRSINLIWFTYAVVVANWGVVACVYVCARARVRGVSEWVSEWVCVCVQVLGRRTLPGHWSVTSWTAPVGVTVLPSGSIKYLFKPDNTSVPLSFCEREREWVREREGQRESARERQKESVCAREWQRQTDRQTEWEVEVFFFFFFLFFIFYTTL